ncbi:MAG TPA: cell division protein ZapA [bacterium]|nr:cell division protein ZapA [bacterium]HOL66621.1 cell division protein ZapA [bacterium]HPP12411.1 cell division protein ZapA [bacterium]
MRTITIQVAGRRYALETSLPPESVSDLEKNIQEELARLQVKHPSSDLIDILVFSLIEKWERTLSLELSLQNCRQSQERMRSRLRQLVGLIEKKIKELTARK